MLTIDCSECIMRQTDACDDCVVSFVVGREPGEALVIDVEEERAVRTLAARRSRAPVAPPRRQRLSRPGCASPPWAFRAG